MEGRWVCKSVGVCLRRFESCTCHQRKRAPDLGKRRIRGTLSCPAVSGSRRLSTAVCVECVSKFGSLGSSKRLLDAPTGDLVLAVKALGVDPEEDLNAVVGPIRNLGRWNARVQPRRNIRFTAPAGR